MRRFKITALAKSIFEDRTDWAVVDTYTGKRDGKFETAPQFIKDAAALCGYELAQQAAA